MAVSVYLGFANVNDNIVVPANFGGWVTLMPTVVTYFIKGIENLLVIGVIIALFGRSVRLYFERDSRLLRNIALIVTVAWFRWILDATAGVVYNAYTKDSSLPPITKF